MDRLHIEKGKPDGYGEKKNYRCGNPLVVLMHSCISADQYESIESIFPKIFIYFAVGIARMQSVQFSKFWSEPHSQTFGEGP